MGLESINFGAALTKAGVPTSGVFQVETGTVIGTVSGAGNAAVVLTAAGMTGSPITLAVPVANLDTATQVAVKIRAALSANAVIAAFFTIGGTVADVQLTRTVSAANDATLNLSIDNGTCTGLTTAASSSNTTSGVLGDYHGVAGGQVVINKSSQTIYQNTGDQYRPVWTLQ